MRARSKLTLSAACLLLLAGMITTAYLGRKSPGISDVQIPPETKEYLEQLARVIGDLRFVRKEGRARDRTNKQEDEEADERGFRKLEGENFLVYYHSQDRARARDVLEYAESSKARMLEVFDHFPTAELKRGRRLPVYLASTESEYYDLSKVTTGSIACVTTDVYDDGLVATMYVSPEVFARDGEYARKVIVHEVAHYTHFDVVDLKNIRNLRMWFTEGLASYTAREEYRLRYAEQAYRERRLIPLAELSAYTNAEAYRSPNIQLFYSEGHSVLQMVEQIYGRKTLTSLVVTASQKTDIGGAVVLVLNLTLGQLNTAWLNHLASARG
jgi:peptidase MA superfamily protein